MHIKKVLGTFAYLIRQSFEELSKNDPLRMAGATAFFTTFALPPILIILIQILGFIVNPGTISQELFQKLSQMLGPDTVRQLINTLVAFRKLAQNELVTIGGFIFLTFVATTLFKIIKGSLNQLWKVKVMHKQSIRMQIRSRLNGFMVILVAGLLFVVGLVTETMQAYLQDYLADISRLFAFYFNTALNYFFSLLIVTLWFAIVFRYLTDAKPRWRVVLVGAVVTSLLFNTGKYIVQLLLAFSNINTMYGAGGSIVLLLLFVFYSSLILYFGAAFTKVWAAYKNMPIKPRHYAAHYQLSENSEQDDVAAINPNN